MAKIEPKRVTILDVARACGVSYQTVSRVINNSPEVAAKTREHVLSVIQELGYRPNKAARSLAGSQSRTLALITFGLEYYGPTQMMVHIERAARQLQYDLVFSNVSHLAPDDINHAIDSLTRWAVDGILVITPVEGQYHTKLLEAARNTPLIQIDTRPDENLPSIIIDQYHGSYLATQHLIDQGHTRIAEISGPLNWFGAQARHRAVGDTMKQAGLKPVAHYEGDWSSKSGYTAAESLLNQAAFTALVVANDQMALGAINALHKHRIRVPGDVSVVGFDNIPEAAYFTPPLTTVHQDFSELGEQGLNYLVQCITDPEAVNGQRVIKPTLIVRESTAGV